MPSAHGAKPDLLPNERVSAFAAQARVAIKADDADGGLALHRLDDTSCALVPKAAAQLDGRDAIRDQVLGDLLGLGIVLRGHNRQLDGGRVHLRAVDCRIYLRRDKDESSLEGHTSLQ
jgi:hypothetical protein